MPSAPTARAVVEFLAKTPLKQGEMARNCGLSAAKMCRFIKGKAKFSKEEANRVAKFMAEWRPPTAAPTPAPAAASSAELVPTDAQRLAAVHLQGAFDVLAVLMRSAQSESVRVDCAKTLAAYAAGKPRQLEPKRGEAPKVEDNELLSDLERFVANAKKAPDAKPA